MYRHRVWVVLQLWAVTIATVHAARLASVPPVFHQHSRPIGIHQLLQVCKLATQFLPRIRLRDQHARRRARPMAVCVYVIAMLRMLHMCCRLTVNAPAP